MKSRDELAMSLLIDTPSIRLTSLSLSEYLKSVKREIRYGNGLAGTKRSFASLRLQSGILDVLPQIQHPCAFLFFLDFSVTSSVCIESCVIYARVR